MNLSHFDTHVILDDINESIIRTLLYRFIRNRDGLLECVEKQCEVEKLARGQRFILVSKGGPHQDCAGCAVNRIIHKENLSGVIQGFITRQANHNFQPRVVFFI